MFYIGVFTLLDRTKIDLRLWNAIKRIGQQHTCLRNRPLKSINHSLTINLYIYKSGLWFPPALHLGNYLYIKGYSWSCQGLRRQTTPVISATGSIIAQELEDITQIIPLIRLLRASVEPTDPIRTTDCIITDRFPLWLRTTNKTIEH